MRVKVKYTFSLSDDEMETMRGALDRGGARSNKLLSDLNQALVASAIDMARDGGVNLTIPPNKPPTVENLDNLSDESDPDSFTQAESSPFKTTKKGR